MKQALLIVMCINAFMWTVFAVTGHVKIDCCTKYVKIPPIGRLKNYKIQKDDGRCVIEAVKFHTVRNKTFCGDPHNKQIKRLVEQLRVKV
uniref:C-C motif chemokine 20-like protein n=1 Tax=Callorhinchus milii TaxID=7868 RepID=V9LAU7_CALMI